MGKSKLSRLEKMMCSFVYKVRQEMNMNQADFATKLRLNNIRASQPYISKIESGKTAMATRKIEKILSLFGYEIDAILLKKADNE